MGDVIIKRSWWTWVLVGLAALAFGIIALAWTGPTTRVLVFLVGIFFFFCGIVLTAHAIVVATRKLPFAGPLVWGLLGITAGVVTVAWPGITALAILYLLAIWAIVTGVIQLYTGFTLKGSGLARFLFAFAGFLSVLFGILLIAFPTGGATAIIWLIGAYAVVMGVIYMIAGFELRHLVDEEKALEKA